MTRLTRLAFFSFVVVASIWTAKPAKAQDQPKSKPAPSSKVDASSIADSVTLRDVQRAADELAIAVQEAVRKATEDPAVKVAALKVAKNAVSAAQIVVAQQAETLEKVLNTLAREIAQASEKQTSKSKHH